MKIPFQLFVVLLLAATTSSSLCSAQEYGHHVVDSLVRSSDWLETAWSKDFELKLTRRKTCVTEPRGEYASSFSDRHLDIAYQMTLLRDSARNEWIVSRAFGWNQLSISNNQQTAYEQHSDLVYANGNGDNSMVLWRQPIGIRADFQGTPAQLLENLFSAEINHLAISILSMERKPGSDFLDYLVDFCLDPSNKLLINKQEELVDGVNRLVYRISMRYSAERVYGIRIVVSESGFDRGLITELHYGYIKKDEFKASYLSENQLQPYPKIYTKTNWQEFSLDESKKITIVVPHRISKREDTMEAMKGAEIARYDFDWKPLSEESKQKINLDEAKKKAEELAKDIDKILNR
jgi:hypothetical protein